MSQRAPATLDRRSLLEEVLIVLGLTVLFSAAFAIIDLLSAPIRGQVRASAPQYQLAKQIVYFVFGLVPVWLVVYLLRRSGEGPAAIGLDRRWPADVPMALYLTLLISCAGLALYLLAYHYGLGRLVVPIPPEGHWWTLPVLVLSALQNGLLEEVIVAGFLLHRLDQAGWRPGAALWTSAVVRGSYHLYQGYGAFAGNLLMGLLFGLIFQRTRRTWPLVIAHTLIDVAAGIGYLLFGDRVLSFA